MDLIICTYNNAKLLDRTLEAIARQQVSANVFWSVIIVDNNCTDETALVVERYISANVIPNLRRVAEPKQGLAYARLCGVQNSTSEWFAFVDDDCLLQEDWVEQAIQFALAHPRCGAFGGKVLLKWEEAPSILEKYAQAFAASDYGEKEKQLSRSCYHIPGAGLVIQRVALMQSGWLDKQFLSDREGQKLTSGGDSEIALRILNAGYELWYTPTCILQHYIPAKRISEAYLAKLYYSFGIAAPYIAAMRWNHSFTVWLTASILRIAKGSFQTLFWAIVAIHQTNKIDSIVFWNWTKGQIMSLYKILMANNKNYTEWFSQFKTQ